MNTKMYIPTEIKVGQQERSDTYTGKLGYVIYKDGKNKWRKEVSWESWRDKAITPEKFENTPLDGFVLNRSAGGKTGSWSSRHIRDAKCRVFDPRGFEIEIDIPNLLYILCHTTSSPGKALDGKFVYAWAGKELVLLPVTTEEYKECTTFSEAQNNKFSLRDLVVGHTYTMKTMNERVYLGRLDYMDFGWNKDGPIKKRHVFSTLDGKGFMAVGGGKDVSHCSNSTPTPEINEFLYNYSLTIFASPIVELVATPVDINIKDFGEVGYSGVKLNRVGVFCSQNGSSYFIPTLHKESRDGNMLHVKTHYYSHKLGENGRVEVDRTQQGIGVNTKAKRKSYFGRGEVYYDSFTHTPLTEKDVVNLNYYTVEAVRANGTTINLTKYI